jgi:mycothiol synthase
MPTDSRLFASESDYTLVRSMLVEIGADRDHDHYCTIGDLDWWRATDSDPDAIRRMRLWFDASRVVAFAWPADDPSAEIVAHPDYNGSLPEILEWAEANALTGNDSDSVTFETWSNRDDTVRNKALRSRGYEQGGPAYRNYAIAIARDPASPSLPAGYTIADLRGATEDDIQRRVDAHRAAFAPSKMTTAKHKRAMASPTYRPEGDLVVVAVDGSFAAFTIVWFDEANKTGLFEPVGTHPDHQRRGLGKAVMAEGLRRLAALGATRALVTSAQDNVASNALYAGAGFEPVDETISWTKKLK